MGSVSAPASHYPATSERLCAAQVEREQLCDLFAEVGPGAPTLCDGWDTHHLAAHLVSREGSPLVVATALAKRRSGDEVADRLVAERSFEALVGRLRAGPPRLSFFGPAFADRWFNAVEFFVHHEDVRRAAPGWQPRELPSWAEDQLWKGLGFTLSALLRKSPVGAAVRRQDTGEMRIGAKKPGTVVVVGLPSELALFVNGRGSVAEVSLEGEPENVAALSDARLGFR
jgi:uncharacterized protein (TIGR03085 family)